MNTQTKLKTALESNTTSTTISKATLTPKNTRNVPKSGARRKYLCVVRMVWGKMGVLLGISIGIIIGTVVGIVVGIVIGIIKWIAMGIITGIFIGIVIGIPR